MKSCVFSLICLVECIFLSKFFKNMSVFLTFLLVFKYVENATETKEALKKKGLKCFIRMY